ncbi:hypothetical protein SNE510_29550 [Streptomyces sp. NE5-10]|nr:hypothetical protein SNE510_29550 [Streptomyces sp. NE5-10]
MSMGPAWCNGPWHYNPYMGEGRPTPSRRGAEAGGRVTSGTFADNGHCRPFPGGPHEGALRRSPLPLFRDDRPVVRTATVGDGLSEDGPRQFTGREPDVVVVRLVEPLGAVDRPLFAGREDVERSGFGGRNTTEDPCGDLPDAVPGLHLVRPARQAGAHRREVDVDGPAPGPRENTGVDERLGRGPVVGEESGNHGGAHGLPRPRPPAGLPATTRSHTAARHGV